MAGEIGSRMAAEWATPSSTCDADGPAQTKLAAGACDQASRVGSLCLLGWASPATALRPIVNRPPPWSLPVRPAVSFPWTSTPAGGAGEGEAGQPNRRLLSAERPGGGSAAAPPSAASPHSFRR